jgi:hypothetical protein
MCAECLIARERKCYSKQFSNGTEVDVLEESKKNSLFMKL